ncbi:MAG: ParB/RepB/Spo0J family partition protein [Flavobacteriaceae bacterium]|nr:ParB/RepB/Spo0J family partition protein [Flavobacteriaceae bacterium]
MAKAIKKQALGRGLSALLKDPDNDIKSVADENADKVVGSIVELELDSIEVNPFQPRTHFDEESLHQLGASIKQLGVIQPITVRKTDFNKFQLVSGERRYRASKLIGLRTIPAYIRIANDQEALEMALVENIQRQDLDPIEIALSYRRLIEEIGLTQEQLSGRIGKKRSTIANYMRLLKLDPIIQTGMRDGFISMGHGRALVNIDDRSDQIELYEQLVSNNWSVREVEQAVQRFQQGGQATAQKAHRSASKEIPGYAKAYLDDLKRYLDADVTFSSGGSAKGKINIPFTSEEDFRRLKKLITGV